MLKSAVMHDIPMDHVAAMERWYYRDHAPEINRRFGPWQGNLTRDTYPFVQSGLDLVSSFLLERPADEFWRDARGYL